MFLNIFGVLTFGFILKALRAGFVLTKISRDELPYAYFLTAVLAGTLITIVFGLARRVSLINLLTGVYAVIVAALLGFMWAPGQPKVLAYLYFVYVEIVAALTSAQFWLLAGYIYDNRQSKRVFPTIGSGAIAGAIAGSAIPGFLSDRLTTGSMILICTGVCVAVVVLSHVAWRYRRPDMDRPTLANRLKEPQERIGDLFRTVLGTRHVALIVLLVFLGVIVGQITEWQFYGEAQDTYRNLPVADQEKAINELSGRFYTAVNALGIVLQLTITSLILRRGGIGLAILILPTAVGFASVGVLARPSLAATLAALGSNSLFRHSINRVGMELLYLPLPSRVRKRIKYFVDVFIDRLGCAIAGVIVLALSSHDLQTALRGTATSVMVLAAASVTVALKVRRSYLESLATTLARREVDTSEFDRYVTDTESIRLLISCLESQNERQVIYGLHLLQAVRGVDFSGQLLPLLQHPSERVRREAMLTLSAVPGSYEKEAGATLSDASAPVREAAVGYLCAQNPAWAAELMRKLDQPGNLELGLYAARCMAGPKDPTFSPSVEHVRRILAIEGSGAEQAAQTAAWLAARLPASEADPILRQLLQDVRPAVAAAAARAAGVAGHSDLLPDILPLLAKRRLRAAARDGLLRLGPPITAVLGEVLADCRWDPLLRREIPWVLSRFQTPLAAEVLVNNLKAHDPLLKYQVVKALNRIHARDPRLPGPSAVVAERIFAETRSYYEALTMRQSLNIDGQSGRGLLCRAIQERLDQNLEIIFRLLGLEYPQRDIYFAYTALKDERSERRASAIEFLDNLLHQNLKSIILPLLEESSTERLVDRASRLFGVRRFNRAEALRAILQQPDAWLKACALHEIGAQGLSGMTEICRELSRNGDPLVRETARWVLQRGV
jgi:AAA family ATP:ADP antiporter